MQPTRVMCILSLCATLTIHSMDNRAIVKSSDGHIFSIPQQKIDLSLVLVKKQLLQKKLSLQPATPIHVPYTRDSLNLFFDAHDAGNNFDQFFDNLTPEQKIDLTSITGKQKLHSPFLTQKILSAYTGKSISSDVMRPHMDMNIITDHLYETIVKAYIKKNPPSKKQKPQCFQENKEIYFNENSNTFCIVPKVIIKENTYLFSGANEKEDCTIVVEHKDKRDQETILFTEAHRYDAPESILTYRLTANTSKPLTPNPCVTCLKTLNHYNHLVNKAFIYHKAPITKSVFSPNSHYLTTYSKPSQEYPYHTFILSTLGTEDNNYQASHMILNNFENKITQWAFNYQATLLAIASKEDAAHSIITILKPDTGDIIETLNNFDGTIHIVQFNRSDTRLLVCGITETSGYFRLYNIENKKNISLLTDSTLNNNKVINHPQFNNAENILHIPTEQGSMIFLNSVSGDIIATSATDNLSLSSVHTVFTPNDSLCISSTFSSEKQRSTAQLWDAKNGSFISHLLRKNIHIRGIGISPNLQYAVMTFQGCKMIRKNLLTIHDFLCLQWIKKSAPFPIMYALYHAYKARCQKEKVPPYILNILKQLPTSPYNVKKIVSIYLLNNKYALR